MSVGDAGIVNAPTSLQHWPAFVGSPMSNWLSVMPFAHKARTDPLWHEFATVSVCSPRLQSVTLLIKIMAKSDRDGLGGCPRMDG